VTPEQRASAVNGIWLCQNCAKEVDNDPVAFPVAVLQDLKSRAELAAQKNLGERPARQPTVNAAVIISGQGAIQISGPNAANLGPNAITIVGPIVHNGGDGS
jgi:hypothetical protein